MKKPLPKGNFGCGKNCPNSQRVRTNASRTKTLKTHLKLNEDETIGQVAAKGNVHDGLEPIVRISFGRKAFGQI
jgi:hypothetical protein